MDYIFITQDGLVTGLTWTGWWALWAIIWCPTLTAAMSRSQPDRAGDVSGGLVGGIFAAAVFALLFSVIQESGGLPLVFFLAGFFLAVVALSVLAWHVSVAWRQNRPRGG